MVVVTVAASAMISPGTSLLVMSPPKDYILYLLDH